MSSSNRSEQEESSARSSNEEGQSEAEGSDQLPRPQSEWLGASDPEELNKVFQTMQNDYSLLAWHYESLESRYAFMQARSTSLETPLNDLTTIVQRQGELLQQLSSKKQDKAEKAVGEPAQMSTNPWSGEAIPTRVSPPGYGGLRSSGHNRPGSPDSRYAPPGAGAVFRHRPIQPLQQVEPSNCQLDNPYFPPVGPVLPRFDPSVLPRSDPRLYPEGDVVFPLHRGGSIKRKQPSRCSSDFVDAMEEQDKDASSQRQSLSKKEARPYKWRSSQPRPPKTDGWTIEKWYKEACSEGLQLDTFHHDQGYDQYKIWVEEAIRRLKKAKVHSSLWVQFGAQAMAAREAMMPEWNWGVMDDLNWESLYRTFDSFYD